MTGEPDLTELDVVKAIRMIADGSTWEDVVDEIYPDSEHRELLASLTRERVHWWYKHQTRDRINEVLS